MYFINKVKQHQSIIKFLISGGAATLIDLIALYFFTDILKIWYLISAILAFTLAFTANFAMQKFWSFNCEQEKKSHHQLILFLLVNLINLSINSFGVYLLVEKMNIWYIFSQVIMSGLIAMESFFVYKLLIFKSCKKLTQFKKMV